ncbi:MAG: hypothetical protein PVG68_18025, partial [Desulfobacterales bacterium]
MPILITAAPAPVRSGGAPPKCRIGPTEGHNTIAEAVPIVEKALMKKERRAKKNARYSINKDFIG